MDFWQKLQLTQNWAFIIYLLAFFRKLYYFYYKYPVFVVNYYRFFPHVEALSAETREENFAKANSPMRSQGLRRFDANLVSEKSAHQSDFSLLSSLTRSISHG